VGLNRPAWGKTLAGPFQCLGGGGIAKTGWGVGGGGGEGPSFGTSVLKGPPRSPVEKKLGRTPRLHPKVLSKLHY